MIIDDDRIDANTYHPAIKQYLCDVKLILEC